MLTVEIKTDNAAFADHNRGPELARILHDLADRVERGGCCYDGADLVLFDYNGNRCGEARFDDPSEQAIRFLVRQFETKGD